MRFIKKINSKKLWRSLLGNNLSYLFVAIIFVPILLIGVIASFVVKDKDEEVQTLSLNSENQSVSSKETEETQKTTEDIEYPRVETGSSLENEWIKDHNILIYKDKGYEPFFGNRQTVEKYAAAVSGVKSSLGDSVQVYNMIAPTAVGFKLSEEYKTLSSSQPENLEIIGSYLKEGIKSVNAYKPMFQHRDEYMYFGTDHHWTALGAYYGYLAFAKEAGFEPIDINALEKRTIQGFVGSYYTLTKNSLFKNNPDYVDYYVIPGEHKTSLYQSGISSPKEVDMYAEYASGGNAYSVFIWGDNPLVKICSETGSGRKIVVFKESFGNAMIPYLAAHYDEVHVIDIRHFKESALDYIKKNEIGEALILNNIMAANTGARISDIKRIFGVKG